MSTYHTTTCPCGCKVKPSRYRNPLGRGYFYWCPACGKPVRTGPRIPARHLAAYAAVLVAIAFLLWSTR